MFLEVRKKADSRIMMKLRQMYCNRNSRQKLNFRSSNLHYESVVYTDLHKVIKKFSVAKYIFEDATGLYLEQIITLSRLKVQPKSKW